MVSSLTVHPPGVVFQRPFSSEDGAIVGLDDAVADARRPAGDPGPAAPTPGRRMYQKGLQTIAWKAEDADGDRLTYVIDYRREGDTAWTPLRSGLSDTIFVWDTTAVADGRYIIRVSATDAASNAADRALVGSRESDVVFVDNTPPVFTAEIERQASARASSCALVTRRARSSGSSTRWRADRGSWPTRPTAWRIRPKSDTRSRWDRGGRGADDDSRLRRAAERDVPAGAVGATGNDQRPLAVTLKTGHEADLVHDDAPAPEAGPDQRRRLRPFKQRFCVAALIRPQRLQRDHAPATGHRVGQGPDHLPLGRHAIPGRLGKTSGEHVRLGLPVVDLHHHRIAAGSRRRIDEQHTRRRAEVGDQRRQRVIALRARPERQEQRQERRDHKRGGDRADADDRPVPVVECPFRQPCHDCADSAPTRLTTRLARPSISAGRPRSGSPRSSSTDLGDLVQARAASFAVFEMLADTQAHRAGQFAVDEPVEIVAHGVAGGRRHADLRASRSVSRARASRDLTVPTATPSDVAISS